jgi:peptidoglycan/xylan/chitin deacetylase (PgdA/CDA1 family)
MRGQSRSKRFAKLLISLGFFCAVMLWNLLRRLCGKKDVGSRVVLYYHSIPPESRPAFARQLDIIVRWAKPIPADVKSQLNGASHYVAVTFDDGFENLIESALPELEKRKIPSTIFIIANALGQFPHWLTDTSERKKHGMLMSADQLQKLPSELVSIGSHTMTHPMLPLLSAPEARMELSGSRANLEKLLNIGVELFSFPQGAFNQDLVNWCREAGYKRVFTSLPLMAFEEPREFLTGRVWAEPTDWGLEFRLKILGAYRWLPVAFAVKRLFVRPSARLISSTPVGGA